MYSLGLEKTRFLSKKSFFVAADLQMKGVTCFTDNFQLVSSVDVVFLCVLPSQLPQVADELKGRIPVTTLIYSFVGTLKASRLQHLMKHSNVIKPEFLFSETYDPNSWNISLEITSAMGYRRMVEKSCPLAAKVKGFFRIKTTAALLTFYNSCK